MRVVLCLAIAVAAAEAHDDLDARAAAVGCFYVWQPNLRYRSGGALVMHQLAGALRRQGACVRMAYVHPRLASHVGADAGAVNLSEAEAAALFAEGIGPEDALVSTEVAPEFALVEDDAHVPHSAGVSSEDSVAANVRAVERRGGVVARWMLAAARDWGDRSRGGSRRISACRGRCTARSPAPGPNGRSSPSTTRYSRTTRSGNRWPRS